MQDSSNSIAIIGMAGRFPGAANTEAFWDNLKQGKESISFFTAEEMLSAGLDPALLDDPNYVNAKGVLDGVELFDASFFGFNPREAEITDPQHRLFLECAWEALEDAGCDPERYEGDIGVFAGSSMSSYLLYIYSNRETVRKSGVLQLIIGNDKDHLPTRVSYKLNLRGPSINVSTACSTSLVAVHLACQSLLSYQCDIALSGGVSIGLPQQGGYSYQPGGILSSDGHCRAFDHRADGTVAGNGVGIVVLKRFDDAIADGDNIRAVIRGSAINNDGSMKVGYTAPSINGQAEVIAQAQALAGVSPETISYIEAHGTGTALGDPIEIAALTKVFRASTYKKNFCAIGSVKTNFGHLDAAAGIAGLIKTVLALEHRMIPPSLHFESPNIELDLGNSPFHVNAKLVEWKPEGSSLRAGVSSFGMGGTNAHVVLEEAPKKPAVTKKDRPHLIVLSARTGSALETATANLGRFLKNNPNLDLGDVAFTLQVGRKRFDHRRALVCRSVDQAVELLEGARPQRVLTGCEPPKNRPVIFMFPGQGPQYVGMGRQLYEQEPLFREQVDCCAEMLKPHLGLDLRQVLFPGKDGEAEAGKRLSQTQFAHPAIFVIEYALARLWMAWGIRPEAMIGHSLGEYVAACIAGVISLEQALSLVARRARLIEPMPTGAMLSVSLSEADVIARLSKDLSLAAINGPSFCVVAGPTHKIDELEVGLNHEGIQSRRLHASHAFHSHMIEPVVAPFVELAGRMNQSQPKIPYISCVTGKWITAAEATDPAYWGRHLRETVRFADGIGELTKIPQAIFLEVGPGQTLSTLARQIVPKDGEQIIINSMPGAQDSEPGSTFLMNALGRLWLAGSEPDWAKHNAGRRRIPLPTYPFERERYWVDYQSRAETPKPGATGAIKKNGVCDWFYTPGWKRTPLLNSSRADCESPDEGGWLLFLDRGGLGLELANRLKEYGCSLTLVRQGERFIEVEDGEFVIDPGKREDYSDLIRHVGLRDGKIKRIVHLWSVSPDSNHQASEWFDAYGGLYSMLFLAQSLEEENVTCPIRIDVVTNDVHDVTGEERLSPEKATVLGACKVIPQELPHINCHNIDILMSETDTHSEAGMSSYLLRELIKETPEPVIAIRRGHRWTQTFERVRMGDAQALRPRLRQGGIYLITGGSGNIGLAIAEYLSLELGAKVILTGRSTLPSEEEWDQPERDRSDELCRRAQAIKSLRDKGAHIYYYTADVADLEQMSDLIEDVEERFGALNGVIHSAGRVGRNAFRSVGETTRRECEMQFAPKVEGVRVLDEVLRGRDLDFCLLNSSVSTILGGLGFLAYSAANNYMDTFAQRQSRDGRVHWISLNWDAWLFGKTDRGQITTSTMAEIGLTPADGVKVFQQALSMGLTPQLIVSTGDLQARIDQWVMLESLRENEGKATKPSGLHARPSLPNAYVAPSTEVERVLAEIWQELLGIEQIGVYDNFFELGGHSLLAVRLVSRLSEAFQIDVPLRAIFEFPTVSDLALLILERQAGQTDDEMLTEMLEELERLSAEEAVALLNEGQLVRDYE